MISLFREFRKRTPLKVFLLAIVLSYSTKVISYKVVWGYLINLNFSNQISYLYRSFIGASPIKIILIIIIAGLLLSVMYSLVKSIRLKTIS